MKPNIYKLVACGLVGMLIAGNSDAQTIYTFSGSSSGFSGDGGPATAATLQSPAAIKYKGSDVYFVDAGNNRARKITGSAYTINTILGDGTSGFSGDGGAATAARIDPGAWGGGIAFDNSGNMYYADIYNHRIRMINASGNISTVAGGSAGFAGDGSPMVDARFSYPIGIATDASGNLYIADQGNNRIRKIDATTGLTSTIAGTGTNNNTGDGGAATAADISAPYGVAIDASGNIYFSTVNLIRKITVATGVISTYATSLSESFAFLEFDQAGNLFAGTEDAPGRVYKVSATGTTSVIAGNGSGPASGDGGPATAAGMSKPVGVTITDAGNLLITNKGNHRIRIITANAATITGTASMCAGANTTLTASIPGAAWISGNTSIATVSSAGVVTGVSAGTATITYVAGLIFGTKVVTVNAPVTPVIAASGTTLSVSAVYASYQWSLGGTSIAGATSATYNATAAGTYAVSVTDAGGCNATSANYVLSSVSVASVAKATEMLLFPNPADGGNFMINIPSGENEKVAITVVNAMGESVYETQTQTNKALAIKMDVPAGVYVIRATSANASYHASIVVR